MSVHFWLFTAVCRVSGGSHILPWVTLWIPKQCSNTVLGFEIFPLRFSTACNFRPQGIILTGSPRCGRWMGKNLVYLGRGWGIGSVLRTLSDGSHQVMELSLPCWEHSGTSSEAGFLSEPVWPRMILPGGFLGAILFLLMFLPSDCFWLRSRLRAPKDCKTKWLKIPFLFPSLSLELFLLFLPFLNL